jgi:hypothetical protein
LLPEGRAAIQRMAEFVDERLEAIRQRGK